MMHSLKTEWRWLNIINDFTIVTCSFEGKVIKEKKKFVFNFKVIQGTKLMNCGFFQDERYAGEMSTTT